MTAPLAYRVTDKSPITAVVLLLDLLLTARPNRGLLPRFTSEEPCLAEKRADVEKLSRQIADAEAELNDRVYRLFHLTPDEIKLLQKQVEH